MDNDLKLILLAIVGFGLLALSLRWGVIGIRGGGVDRHQNPAAYWMAIATLAFGSGSALLLGLMR